jgi:sulfate permease, SulP family
LVVALILGWRERTVGTVSLDLPPVVSFTWRPADLIDVLPPALGLAIVTAVNILITSRVVEHFQGRHRGLRPADADAELGAYGIANLCAGAFGAPISVGIPARSVANVRCGGSTRLSNFLHGLVLLGLIQFGAGLIAVVPLAALAGVTAYVGFSLLEWSTWRRLPRMRRVDAAAFLCTAVTVLAANAIAAVVVGCALHAAGDLLARSSLVAALPVPVPVAESGEADS